MEVILPGQFTVEDAAIALKYLNGEPLSAQQRIQMLAVFDSLHTARVRQETSEWAFRAVYRDVVDQPHADAFIADLYTPAYFLDAARTRSLSGDFYITQLTGPGRHKQWAVFLQSGMWERINGPTVRCSLPEVLALFPRVARVERGDVVLIVAAYEVWKDRIRRQQVQSQEHTHE